MKSNFQIFARDLIWTLVLIAFNPFNLIALYSRYTGKVFVGMEHATSTDPVKAYLLPTLVYAVIWLILKKWRRWSYWNLYFFSFLGAIAVFYIWFKFA
ncbi:hypothetical protein [Bdellovibrio sp. GT3]|uniref:hypothetical protein n=1 Tax=Bdellovibrio sp. GT3 TaxID=3136282 RepID=UPI0030F21DA2